MTGTAYRKATMTLLMKFNTAFIPTWPSLQASRSILRASRQRCNRFHRIRSLL